MSGWKYCFHPLAVLVRCARQRQRGEGLLSAWPTLAYQTDDAGTLLATFTYDNQGTPVSVQVGSDPSTAPRYYYVYNGHRDVTFLTDASGSVVASYLYDSWGNLTSNSEAFANGWTNPYRYDGRDGARQDLLALLAATVAARAS